MKQSSHPTHPCQRRNEMDYVKKIERMDNHLREHPHDYQTVIARIKLASDAIDYQMHKEACMRLKRVAEVRRQLKEIEDGRQM